MKTKPTKFKINVIMNDKNEEGEDDEDFYPPMHNFSALNSIKPTILTDEELAAKKEKEEIMSKIHQYDMLFPRMAELMYKSYLDGKTLDEAYEEHKDWGAFM